MARKRYREVKTDKYANFRVHFKRLKQRNKRGNKVKISKTLTLADIKRQWDKQKGLCAYTGVQMTHRAKTKKPNQASIDRIDSSRAYEAGNIQFVCLAINLAKTDFTDEVFRKFVGAIKAANHVV